MYNDIGDILETISMIRDKNLDVRTTTMGISLLDCADSDIDRSCEKIYERSAEKRSIWWKPAKRLPESTEFQL